MSNTQKTINDFAKKEGVLFVYRGDDDEHEYVQLETDDMDSVLVDSYTRTTATLIQNAESMGKLMEMAQERYKNGETRPLVLENYERLIIDKDEKDIDIINLIENLYGEQTVSDDTYFSYDFGDGELIDDEGIEFFYHVEYGYDDNDSLYLQLFRFYDSESVECDLSIKQHNALESKVHELMEKNNYKIYTYDELEGKSRQQKPVERE